MKNNKQITRVKNYLRFIWWRILGRKPMIGIDFASGPDMGCEVTGYKDRKGRIFIIQERLFFKGDDSPQKYKFREQWEQCRDTWGKK